MSQVFIGVDPGKSGYFSIYDPSTDGFTFILMPEHKVDSGKKLKSGLPEMKNEFYPEGMRQIVFDIKKQFPTQKFVSCIEDVCGRQGWSAENNFNFGHIAGLQLMVLIMLGASIEFVRPQKWQSMMYQGFNKVMVPSSTGKTMIHDTKATSAIISAALRPDISFARTERSKTIDDNKTDAFLITMYCYKNYMKNNPK
jgi:hypothetical protein